jgi:MFS family permease
VDGIRPLYWMQVVGFSMLLMLILNRFNNPYERKESKVNLDFVNSLREVFLQGKSVKRYIVYSLLFATPFFVTNVYLPLYAMEVKGANEYVISSMKAASWILPLLLAIPVGRLADIFGRKRIIYITTLLYCTSLLFLVYAIDSTTLIISGIFQGFYMLSAVTSGAISAELVPISILGRWFGITSFFRGLVSMLGPIIGGILWSIIDPSFVFFFLIAVMLMSILLLMTIPETLKKRIS